MSKAELKMAAGAAQQKADRLSEAANTAESGARAAELGRQANAAYAEAKRLLAQYDAA